MDNRMSGSIIVSPGLPSVDAAGRVAQITMRRMGEKGRWGNQIVEYAFIRAYAKRYRLAYELSPWPGQYYFGLPSPPVTVTLPEWNERYLGGDIYKEPFAPIGDECCGCDFNGYAQYHTSYYRPDRELIQSLFRPTDRQMARLWSGLARLRCRGGTLVGLHLRRGDNGRLIFPVFPMSWYHRWLKDNWPRLEAPVMFIATEDYGLVDEFGEYEPQTRQSLGIPLDLPPVIGQQHPCDLVDNPEAIDCLPDWWFLANCDVILCPDSAFSFSAAWVNPRLRELWRARLSLRRFEQVDPWNTDFLTRESLLDYPNVPGTSLRTNPRYWGSWVSLHNGLSE